MEDNSTIGWAHEEDDGEEEGEVVLEGKESSRKCFYCDKKGNIAKKFPLKKGEDKKEGIKKKFFGSCNCGGR